MALELAVKIKHEGSERSVVAAGAYRIGQQGFPGLLIQVAVKIFQRATECFLAERLRLVLVEHTKVGRQARLVAVRAEKMRVLTQELGAERVDRFYVRLVDEHRLATQMRILRRGGEVL
ncbi:hypothetical protein SDC9_113065 [bioreactor metagenome]|uniref:Uncharacterized protein n=1 Tax=bioreactor metagenome TaxID=1076179 RepID=A0A645BLZ2_9ZZZZ